MRSFCLSFKETMSDRERKREGERGTGKLLIIYLKNCFVTSSSFSLILHHQCMVLNWHLPWVTVLFHFTIFRSQEFLQPILFLTKWINLLLLLLHLLCIYVCAWIFPSPYTPSVPITLLFSYFLTLYWPSCMKYTLVMIRASYTWKQKQICMYCMNMNMHISLLERMSFI